MLAYDRRQRAGRARHEGREAKGNAGHHFFGSDGAVFHNWNFLRSWLRTSEVRSELMHAGDAALLVICALLFGYLLYALLKAEEF
jgi:K+-transporting ATPase KdpF subunit